MNRLLDFLSDPLVILILCVVGMFLCLCGCSPCWRGDTNLQSACGVL